MTTPCAPGDVVARSPARVAARRSRAAAYFDVARLVDRVDRAGPAALRRCHQPVVVPDRAALDLEHDDADVRHQDDQVGLVVLVLVGEPKVGEQHVVGAEAVAQPFPHLALGVRWRTRATPGCSGPSRGVGLAVRRLIVERVSAGAQSDVGRELLDDLGGEVDHGP